MLKEIKIVPNNLTFSKNGPDVIPISRNRLVFPIYKQIKIPSYKSINKKIKLPLTLSINTDPNRLLNKRRIMDKVDQEFVNNIKNFINETTEDIEIDPKEYSFVQKLFSNTPSKRDDCKEIIIPNKKMVRACFPNNKRLRQIYNYSPPVLKNFSYNESGEEMKNKIKQIENISLNIQNICNKINIVTDEINIRAYNKNLIDRKCLDVLCNSQTIKTLQKKFDKEIPETVNEINELNKQIFFVKKEKEMNVSNFYNYLTEIKLSQEDIEKRKFLIEKMKKEIKEIKNEIFLMQSVNKNIKLFLIRENDM